MEAGESAFDVARRQREKAARLERSAAMWERGAHGEVEVARVLATLSTEWIVLHDIAWPGRQRANIDHVAIGPGGVFVVDAKNWTGRIEVRDQVLMQNGRRREETVASAAQAAIALQAFVAMPVLCMGVLCFVRDEPMSGWARDVMVCTTANLPTMLGTRPRVMSAHDVQECAGIVRRVAVRQPPMSQRRAAAVPPREQSAPASYARLRHKSRRPVAKVVAALIFLAFIMGGGLSRIGEWTGEQLVEQVSPDEAVPSIGPPDVKAVDRTAKKHRTKKSN